jgi:protein-tyrosine phosphatase
MSERIRVLMVCLGNICRSPTAEAVFRARVEAAGLAGLIEVDSAGTSDWHVGDPPHPPSIEAAARRGYDLRPLRARQVKREDFETFHHVLAMDRQNLADLRRLCPPGREERLWLFLSHGTQGREEVPDPYGLHEAVYTEVLDLVEDASDGLLRHLIDVHGLVRHGT